MSKLFAGVGVLLIFGAIGLLLLQSQPDAENESITTATEPSTPNKTITKAAFTDQCTIEMQVSGSLVTLESAFDPTVAKCDQYSVVVVSPTGAYAAYENLSSTGVDAMVVLYSAQLNRSFVLDDYGEQSVIDMAFLPIGRLLVLYSQGLSGTQTLRLYDIPRLENELSALTAEQELSQEVLSQFVYERSLEQSDRSAQAIRLTSDSVVLVDEEDDLSNPVYQVSLQDL